MTKIQSFFYNQLCQSPSVKQACKEEPPPNLSKEEKAEYLLRKFFANKSFFGFKEYVALYKLGEQMDKNNYAVFLMSLYFKHPQLKDVVIDILDSMDDISTTLVFLDLLKTTKSCVQAKAALNFLERNANQHPAIMPALVDVFKALPECGTKKDLERFFMKTSNLLAIDALLAYHQTGFSQNAQSLYSWLKTKTNGIESFKDIYVVKMAADDPSIKPLLKNRNALIEHINKKMSSLPHLTRTAWKENVAPAGYTEDFPGAAANLSMCDLYRVYYLLASLEKIDVRKEIGTIIDADIKDKGAEFGGTTNFNNGTLSLHPIPASRSLVDNGSYVNVESVFIHEENIKQYHAFSVFHMHALEKDCSKYAGPSTGDFLQIEETNLTGVVITSTANLQFDVDYYISTKTGKKIIIDLGVYNISE